MKALSIRQPYANLIADGKKKIEVRSWVPARGVIGQEFLVCSMKSPGFGDGPFGSAICKVKLLVVREFNERDLAEACIDAVPRLDRTLFSWVLGAVTAVDHFPVKGKQGFFNVEIPPLNGGQP